MEALLFILPEAVPSEVPAILHVVLLTFIRKVATPRWSPHRKSPYLALGHFNAGIINNTRLVSP
jgi:hypothetical protein